MEKQQFEEELTRMSKPEIHGLKHAELLPGILARAKDKWVVSGWWLSLPLYVLAMLAMKTAFMPHSRLLLLLHESIARQRWQFLVLFVAAPLVLIAVNIATLRKLHFLSGSPGWWRSMRIGWRNVLVILLSLLMVFIYL